MKCCDMSAGMLNKKITIQRKTRTPDGVGGVTESWSDLATVYANMRAVSGTEQIKSMRVAPLNRYRAYIRFKADVDGNPYYSGEDRVYHQGRYYNIEHVLDIGGERKWLEITMVEGGNS